MQSSWECSKGIQGVIRNDFLGIELVKVEDEINTMVASTSYET
jgi:hypothetical protein